MSGSAREALSAAPHHLGHLHFRSIGKIMKLSGTCNTYKEYENDISTIFE
jgi:hypothetical protein